MIPKHSEEVLNALNKLELVVWKKLTAEESREAVSDLLQGYTGSRLYRYPIWENLKDWIGIDYKFAWEWFSEILKNKEIILLFEPGDTQEGFLFYNGAELVNALNDCYRFTFYVTDPDRSFLFCYNDHDNLIACGDAKEWLSNYRIIKAENIKIFKSNPKLS